MKKYTFSYSPNGINKIKVTILAKDRQSAKDVVKNIAEDVKSYGKIK